MYNEFASFVLISVLESRSKSWNLQDRHRDPYIVLGQPPIPGFSCESFWKKQVSEKSNFQFLNLNFKTRGLLCRL